MKARKKSAILLVANWKSDVGYAWWLMEGFWITIANHLVKKNIASVLIYPEITTLPETIAGSRISVKEFDFKCTGVSELIKLIRFIKQHSIRHIYLSDHPAYSWRYLLLHLVGVKDIIIHDHTPGERNAARGFRKMLKTLIQRTPLYTADIFIAVTQFVLNRFYNVACIPKHKCHVAPNGIRPLNLEQADLHYAQRFFNIPDNRQIVITSGRATYYKGIDFFIECANEIIHKRNHSNFHFLFCGDGPDLESFKTLVGKYGLDEHFTFAGRRTDIREILPSCHIGFHAALGEVGYSLSILEYMSARLITVIPNNPSTALATTDKVTGYLYDRSSVKSAADSIIEASKNTDANAKIKETAKQYVDENLTIEHTHAALRAIMDKIL